MNLSKLLQMIALSQNNGLPTLRDNLQKLRQKRSGPRAWLRRVVAMSTISNLGSFGENVYKIGLTRRLDPLDRVKELGDASVPFSFDVHALIYSDDAPALETSFAS